MKKFFIGGFLGIIVAVAKELINYFFRHKTFETTDFFIDLVIAFLVFGLSSTLFKSESKHVD